MVDSHGDIVLVGGGGHSLVVAEAARRAGLNVSGFVDDRADAVLGHGSGSIARLGPVGALPGLRLTAWHLAIGDVRTRRVLLDSIHSGRAVEIVDPTGVAAGSAQVGAGTFIAMQAVVQSRAELGPHCIVNTGAIIEHECLLAANVHVAPGAVLGGRVQVGADTLIGLGARVLPGVKIGRQCVIGAGAVVISDVPDGGRVAGVPARAI